MDVEREKLLGTTDCDLGRIPTLGPEYQLHDAQRTESGEDPVVRFKPLRERYRPLRESQGGYLADIRLKMNNRDIYSSDHYIHARLYPREIQRMAHKDKWLALWDNI